MNTIILRIRNIFSYPIRLALSFISDPREKYNPSEVTDLGRLIRRVQVGDVLLVSGNARISYVVKLLTLSQWSHVVLYVGNRQDLLSDEQKERWSKEFGYNALKHLVVDADPVYGVHLCPIEFWTGLMVRQCRAEGLKKKDKEKVVNYTLKQLGREYDMGHIIRLLFFFAFPWELLPQRARRLITDFTLSEDDRICSRIIAEAFYSVNYPIRPVLLSPVHTRLQNRMMGLAGGLQRRIRTSAKLFLGGRLKRAFGRLSSQRYAEVHLKGLRHLTPADYDLSRFFSIIKDDLNLNIDYSNSNILLEKEVDYI